MVSGMPRAEYSKKQLQQFADDVVKANLGNPAVLSVGPRVETNSVEILTSSEHTSKLVPSNVPTDAIELRIDPRGKFVGAEAREDYPRTMLGDLPAQGTRSSRATPSAAGPSGPA
jgi:hypothetical protein